MLNVELASIQHSTFTIEHSTFLVLSAYDPRSIPSFQCVAQVLDIRDQHLTAAGAHELNCGFNFRSHGSSRKLTVVEVTLGFRERDSIEGALARLAEVQ